MGEELEFVRSERVADVEAHPSENGGVRVRLRSPEDGAPPRSHVRRRLVQPLPLIGALLVVVALGGYWSVYRATTDRSPVLVAARDLQAGMVVRPSDLRIVELAGDAATLDSMVREQELESVLGRELASSVPAGAPLARGSVAAAGSRPAAFTLVVPTFRALGGSLLPGDRVTVLATFDTGSGAQSRVIARGLRVLEIGESPEGLDRASASIPVTVVLRDPSLVAGLALANSEGKIDLLREGGNTRIAPIPPASERGSP